MAQHRKYLGGAKPSGSDAQILEMAMRKEKVAADFYGTLAKIVEREDSRRLLTHLKEEEERHYGLLRNAMMSGDNSAVGSGTETAHMGLADFQEEKEIDPQSSPADILKLAIRREEEAEEFYLGRAHTLQDHDLAQLYHKLALEEKNHRAKLMHIYEEQLNMGNA